MALARSYYGQAQFNPLHHMASCPLEVAVEALSMLSRVLPYQQEAIEQLPHKSSGECSQDRGLLGPQAPALPISPYVGQEARGPHLLAD